MSTYPTPLGKRLAIDEDGTLLFKISSGNVPTQMSHDDLVTLNNENNDQVTADTMIALYFPTPRSISAMFVATDNAAGITLEYSNDTTNFIDGSWSAVASPGSSQINVSPQYRTNQLTIGLAEVKALRMTCRTIYKAWHVYGIRESGDFLDFSDFAGNALPDGWMDYGDTIRGGSEDRTVYVTNRSLTQDAHGVVVTAEALTDTTPSVPAQYVFSLDKMNWHGELNIGDVAAGAVSVPVCVRRITPTSATLGLWAARLQARATSWSV